MVSARYAPYVFAFLAPAMLVVLLHSYIGLRAEDCSKATSLFAGQSKGPGLFREKRLGEVFEAERWEEGSLPVPRQGWQANFAVVQSYDAKKLYHRPEMYLIRESTPSRRAVEQVKLAEDLVAIHHVYYPASESIVLHAAYLLIYDSQPVANPYLAQIRLAPWQIVRGTYPMTLSFVAVSGPAGAAHDLERQSVAYLLDSWREFRSACVR